MKKMRFLPELSEFLNRHGYVYTVRKFRYALEDRFVEVDGVGTCQRQLIGTANRKEDLTPFVDKSGFKTTRDWWKKIKGFNRGYVGHFYIYEVTISDEEETS